MCEFEEIVELIRAKYNLAEAQSVTNFVDNLAEEVNFYKRRSHSYEMDKNDIRAILGLQPGESIIEAVKALKRESEPRYEERILDPVRMMQWLVEHGWKVNDRGNWFLPSGLSIYFTPKMWEYCGAKKPDLAYVWLNEWIDKVEVK